MIKSSMELLKYIAANESLELSVEFFNGETFSDITWKDGNMEAKISDSNPSFIADLTGLMMEEVFYPNISEKLQYSIKPVLYEGEIAFEFHSFDVASHMEIEREGKESLDSIFLIYMNEIKQIPGFEDISLDNVNDFLNLDHDSTEIPNLVFDKNSNSWITLDEHPFKEILESIYAGIVESIDSKFESEDNVIVENNTIRYFTSEQLEGENFIVEVDLGDIFEDEIEYDI